MAPLHAVENALMNLLRHAGVLLATQVDVAHAAKTKQSKLLRAQTRGIKRKLRKIENQWFDKV